MATNILLVLVLTLLVPLVLRWRQDVFLNGVLQRPGEDHDYVWRLGGPHFNFVIKGDGSRPDTFTIVRHRGPFEWVERFDASPEWAKLHSPRSKPQLTEAEELETS